MNHAAVQRSHRHRYLTPDRIRRQLVLLAVMLWAIAIAAAATPTWRLRTGQVKGTDFVHFYTLARVGATRPPQGFADLNVQRALQLAARPESHDDWYPPVYGPQVAAALAPLGFLSYGWALVVWLSISGAAYLFLMRRTIGGARRVSAFTGLAVAGAVAFPPFWELVLHGQLSVVAMAAAIAACVALQRGRARLAGALLGVLGYKLSLFIPALAVLVVSGAWTMALCACAVAAAQVLLGALVAGPGSLMAYARMLIDSPALIGTLAAKPYQMHSWRAFWLLVSPSPSAALALYVVCSALTVAAAAIIWRRTADPTLRISALALATVLCAPHLYVYDLVILAPVWIWLIDWYLDRPDLNPNIGRLLYAGYAAPLAGPVVARFAHVQISTLCFAALLAYLWQDRAGSRERSGVGRAELIGT